MVTEAELRRIEVDALLTEIRRELTWEDRLDVRTAERELYDEHGLPR